MRLCFLSDFHFTKLTINPLRLFPKRIFGHLNWLVHRKKTFCHQQLEALPHLFRSLNVDLVLLGGDFTSSSMPEEFELAKNWIKHLSSPWIAIPGNHDNYTQRSARNKVFNQYFPTSRSKAHKIGENLWVVAMDTSRPNRIRSARGIFSKEHEFELEELLSQIPGKVILLNHYPFFLQENIDRTLEGGEALERLIRRHPNIILYLHGHTHRSSCADLRIDHLPIVLDSGCCSLKQGGSWNLIDLSEDRCNITKYEWQGAWKPQETKEFVWTS
jgi:3',5'-cyclic AMP phosphodiesterase CpdA